MARRVIAAVVLAIGILPDFGLAAAPSPIYVANWGAGTAGWQLPRGWGVAHGTLAYTGRGESVATVPFALPRGLHDYTVQAEIAAGKRMTDDPGAWTGYGVALQIAGQSAMRAGIHDNWNILSGEASVSGATMRWGTSQIGGEAFALSTGWHRLAFQVHGDAYRLTVDGEDAVQWVRIPSGRQVKGVGVWSDRYRIRVRDFRVLPAAPAPVAPVNLTALRAIAVQPSDLPAGFATAGVTYYSNPEYERALGVDATAVRKRARLMSLSVTYSSAASAGLMQVYNGIGLYAKHAVAGYRTGVQIDESLDGAGQNFRTVPVGSDIGERRAAFFYNDTLQGKPVSVLDIEFLRGHHTAAVTLYYAGTTLPPDAMATLTALCKAIDGRIQRAERAAGV